MSSEELSFESPPSLRVTWTIPNFRRQAMESNHSLQSPDFTFARGRYCLRMLPTRDMNSFHFPIEIELLNFTDTDPGRAVLYEVDLKSRIGEIDMHHYENNKKVFLISRSDYPCERDLYLPGGTLTVLCSVRLRKQSSAGGPKSGGAQSGTRRTGKLSSESFPFPYVTWKIPAFFQPTRDSMYTLQSPEFPISDRRYCLRLLSYRGRIDIQLVNLTDTVPGRYVSYEVGLKSTTGEEIYIGSYGVSTERKFYIFRSALDDMKPECFPDGQLSVFCSVRSREQSSAGSPKSSGAETSNKEEDKEGLRGISTLLLDLRQLLQKMPDSDACLIVSGKEFRAHKMMLRARSKVFDAMFGDETAERESGRVVIDDLDPDSIGDFLEYLYTGGIGAGLSDDNAFGLYKAADKYNVSTLKSECVTHMRRSLSVDTFCDVLAVALRHSEEELLSQADLFFKENMPQIIVTAKWKKFATDNGERATDLFMKVFAPPGQ